VGLDREVAIWSLNPIVITKVVYRLRKLLSTIVPTNVLYDRVRIYEVEVLPPQRCWRIAGIANNNVDAGGALVEDVKQR